MKSLKYLFCVILFILPKNIYSEFQFAGDIKSYSKVNGSIEFVLTNSLLNIYVVEQDIIRFRYTNKDKFSEAPSYAVIYNNTINDFQFSEKTDHYELTTNEIKVTIDKAPCRISIYDKNGILINEDEKSFGVSFDNDEVRCFKKLYNDENFFGLGEKTGSLNKRGSQYTMWNSDNPAYGWSTDPIYQSIPFFIGVRSLAEGSQNKTAYGIFFDNTYKSYFNMGASNNRFYWFGAEKGEMDYYFMSGPEIKKVVASYTKLTGRMELPPMWALGYQQSKWSYYPESTVRALANNFRSKDIPCDVIYLDIHYMNGYRVFTWDKDRFPDPEKLLGDLDKMGFKVVPIIDPGVKADTNYFAAKEGLAKDLFVKYPDGVTYQGEVWPSWAYFPDFTKQTTRDWWGEKLSALLKQGIDGFWNDMNEPAVWGQSFPDIVQFDDNGFKSDHKKIHNVFALNMAKATSEGLKKYDKDNRHFVLTRAGFAGIQRYSAVWTGDNVANQDHLRLACVMPQGMGLSGIAFAGSDVGGFMENPTPNLYTRWMQLGVFTPFFRGHSVINTRDKEPWAFGEDVERMVKDAISLRYKLIPYMYNEFYNSSVTGLPIMRPMFLNYQNDNECYSGDAQYQFMVGDNMLVAPVVGENDQYKKLYLPEGKWLDWWTHKVYDGKQWLVVEAPLWKIPVFIKEGAVVPARDVQEYIGEKDLSELELNIFPSEKSMYTFYEDDGTSYQYKNGKFSLTKINVEKNKNKEFLISLGKAQDNFETKQNSYLMKIFGVNKPSGVSLNNKSLTEFPSIEKFSNNAGYFFNDTDGTLNIRVPKQKEIKVSFK